MNFSLLKLFIIATSVKKSLENVILADDYTLLTCQFYEDVYYGYTCLIDGVTIDFKTKIGYFDGDHLKGKGDDDVTGFRFENSNMSHIPSEVFSQFKNLQIYNVSFNELQTIKPLWKCGNLKKLIVTDNKLSSLSENTFSACSNLEELWLQQNSLIDMDANAFNGLQNLKVLYLFNNLIANFPDNVFQTTPNLEQLWLNNIKITELNPKWFLGLSKVSGLSLFGNQLSNLHPDTFKPLLGLERIDFDYDGVEALEGHLFDTCVVIKEISLRFNKITAIGSTFLDELKTLKLLDLRGNICANKDFTLTGDNLDDVKSELKTCFLNYKDIKEHSF